MAVLKKGMGPTKKKLFSRTKLKLMYQTKKIWWGPQILFYKHENSFAKVCTKQTRCFFFYFFLFLYK